MTNTSIELYNALLEAGVSRGKAKEAAKTVISRDEAQNQLATKEDILMVKTDLLKLESKLITWMIGLQAATITLTVGLVTLVITILI
jgi:hypothetical protein